MVAYVSREQWGAQHGRGHPLAGTVAEINLHHTVGPDTYASAAAEIREVQGIERFHAVSNDWDRIGYTWLISPTSGTAYEGCGWGWVGAHTEGRNSKSYGIAFMGNGEVKAATPAAWSTARALIEAGIKAGYVTPYPRIHGHRAWKATACPGRLNVAKLDLLAGISGSGAELEEDDMPLNTNDLTAIEELIRKILGESVTKGQSSWAGMVGATLNSAQRTFNVASANGAQLAAVSERLEGTERELAAMRQLLDELTRPPVDPNAATMVLPEFRP